MNIPGGGPHLAAIYVRISEDREGARLGVKRQEEDCRALADRLGWEVFAVYEDNDLSAYSGKPRPGYRRLMEDLDHGDVSAVIAWHPDRLHRRPAELEEFIDLIERREVAVATVQAGELDLATPSGRLVARQLGSVARYESEHKAERVRRALAQRRQAGVPHGGRRVYGYQGTTIVPDEAEHITWAVERLCRGAAWNVVVRGLGERGSATINGQPWDRSGLKKLLTNPRLRGALTYRGQVMRRGAWPAIISEQQWALLQSRIRPAKPGPSGKPRHLLSGILRCGKCGLGLVRGPGRTIRGTTVPSTYHCAPAPGGIRRGCGGITILQPNADKAVTAIVLDALGNVRPSSRERDEVAGYEATLAELRTRQQEIAAGLASGALSVAVAGPADAQIRDEIARVERRLGRALASRRVARLEPTDVHELWAGLDVDQRRALVSDVIEKIIVKPVGRGWHGQALDRMDVVWRR